MISSNQLPVDHQLSAEVRAFGRDSIAAKGTALFKQGEEPHDVYLLRSGKAELTATTVDGSLRYKTIAPPGSILGLPAMFANLPYSMTATVVEDADIVAVPRGPLLDRARRDGDFATRILRLLGEEVQVVRLHEPVPTSPAPVHELQKRLQQLDRRDWSLWSTAGIILILLCFAVLSLSFPALGRREEIFFQDKLDVAVRSLFALVLLFTLFALYQQYLIKQLRRQLQAQIAILSELNGRAETVERLLILDELTGLFNRRFAIEYLSREIARCERDNVLLIVVMIDLDDFKAINATYGRAAGDAVLQRFAHHIRKGIRSADLPVRVEGDQFLIILTGCGVDDVYRPLERLRGCEVQYEGNTIRVNFSVAWVQSRQGELAGELQSRAEEALHQQKYAKSSLARRL